MARAPRTRKTAAKPVVAPAQERVTSTVEFVTQRPSTRVLDDTMDHAWLVGCERTACAHQVLVAKYNFRPVSYANPDGALVKTTYTAPGRRYCTAHVPS